MYPFLDKYFLLSKGWTLLAHDGCRAFVETTQPQNYSIIDWNNQHVATLELKENSFILIPAIYGLKHQVNISKKIITLYYVPDDLEE